MSHPQVGTYCPAKDIESAEQDHVAEHVLIFALSGTIVLLQHESHWHGTAGSMDLGEASTQSFQLCFGILADIFVADR